MQFIRSALLLSLLVSATLSAQTTTGSLHGRVVGGDGFGLPGTTVTVTGDHLVGERTTTTNANGDYRVRDLPPGEYTVTVRLEGFATSQRQGLSVRLGQSARADFLLQLAEVTEEIIITSSTSAATNFPATLTGSELPRGGIINVWGFNVGPDNLTNNPTVPFDKTVAGFSAFVETGGERYDAFPLFVFQNQSAVILGSGTPLGEGNLFMEGPLGMSNPLRINVVDHQPGIFTHQGAGIFTQLDFSLITPQNPAMPGDTIIGWGMGFAPGQFDDRPGAFDKRDSLTDFTFFFGGTPIPDSDILYIGSGGSVGVDQWIGTVSAGTPFGCAVPFRGVRNLPGGDRIISNVVSLPISADGRTCGDPHGLPSDLVDQIHQGSLNLTSNLVSELAVLEGDELGEFVLAELLGESVNSSSFWAPNPIGTCAHGWEPEGFVGPFLPAPLEFAGVYTMTLPWAIITVAPDSNFGPFQQLNARPAPATITDGIYSFSTDALEIGGTPTFINGGGDYSRKSGRLKDAVQEELSDTYRADGFISISQAIDATIQAGGGEPGTVLHYRVNSDSGPFGSQFLNCYSSAEPAALAASRDSLIQQSWDILSTRFSGASESGNVVIRYFDLETNRGPRGPGIESGEEIFDSLINAQLGPDAPSNAVGSCQASALCP